MKRKHSLQKLISNIVILVIVYLLLWFSAQASFLPTIVRNWLYVLLMGLTIVFPFILVLYGIRALMHKRRLEGFIVLVLGVALILAVVPSYVTRMTTYMKAMRQPEEVDSVASSTDGEYTNVETDIQTDYPARAPETEEVEEEEMEEPMEQPSRAPAAEPSRRSAAAESDVIAVNALDELNLYTSKPGVVVAKVFAPWCGPCKMIAPEFKQAAQDLGDAATFVEINGDEFDGKPELNIEGFPTMIIFKDGQEVDRMSGFMRADEIKNKINRYL